MVASSQQRQLLQAEAAIPSAIEASRLALAATERAPVIFEYGALAEARRQLRAALASLTTVQGAVEKLARQEAIV